MKYCLILSLLFSLPLHSQNFSTESFDKLNFLLGNWVCKEDTLTYYEQWKKINDSTYHGVNYYHHNISTKKFESMQLLYRNNKIIYKAIFDTGNGFAQTSFVMKSADFDKYVFENSRNDFPTSITYQMSSLDNYRVILAGSKTTMRFDFFRQDIQGDDLLDRF